MATPPPIEVPPGTADAVLPLPLSEQPQEPDPAPDNPDQV